MKSKPRADYEAENRAIAAFVLRSPEGHYHGLVLWAEEVAKRPKVAVRGEQGAFLWPEKVSEVGKRQSD